MARKRIQLVSDERLQKMTIQQKIDTGTLNKPDYDAATTEEQTQMRDVLFEMYAQKVNVAQALSGLEFSLFALAKIFFKKEEGIALTTTEQNFYDQFKETVSSHELTLDPNEWYLGYLNQVRGNVQNNRIDYKAKKVELFGAF